jgi:hypothetical protein
LRERVVLSEAKDRVRGTKKVRVQLCRNAVADRDDGLHVILA